MAGFGEQPPGGLRRVRLWTDPRAGYIRFQDPDQNNRFISREEGLSRIQYNPMTKRLEDSFGVAVGPGIYGISAEGVIQTFAKRTIHDERLTTSVSNYKTQANQEIVEHTVMIDPDGKAVHSYISYGLGNNYRRDRRSKAWYKNAIRELDPKGTKKLGYNDLKEAIIHREFIIREVI